jgi:hypothetical protein
MYVYVASNVYLIVKLDDRHKCFLCLCEKIKIIKIKEINIININYKFKNSKITRPFLN